MDGRLADRVATLLDHAYAPARSLSAWLDRLTGQLGQLAPGSLGTAGRLVHAAPGAAPTLVCPYTLHVERDRVERAFAEHQQVSEHRVDVVGGSAGLRSFRRTIERNAERDPYLRSMIQRFDAVGVRNLHHLTASTGCGYTVSLGMMSQTPERVGVPRLLWAVLEDHLATSLRLQVRLHRERTLPRDHSSAARATSHGRPLDRCRAEAIWCGILDGTWAVLSRRDDGSRQHVVAIPSDPDHRDRRALTERETRIASLVAAGHSDKEIAYALDLARSTITGHLQDALRKLHIPSRLVLASAFTPSPYHNSLSPRVLSAVELPCGAAVLTLELAPACEHLPARLRARLSQAEARVAELALRGYTDAEIADATGRARHTISNQLRMAYRRLGVHSRSELAVLARELAN